MFVSLKNVPNLRASFFILSTDRIVQSADIQTKINSGFWLFQADRVTSNLYKLL